MRYRPLWLVLTALWAFQAHPAPLESGLSQGPTAATRSFSGQFVMARSTGGAGGFVLPPAGGANQALLVDLDPMLLPISCERIKQALLQELGARDNWAGKVYLSIRPAMRFDPGILITSEQYRNGWQYRLELPNPVDRQDYVRAIVQTLLLEIANRNNGGEAAEVPVWLVEGLAQCILTSKEIEVILAPPNSGIAVGMSPSFAAGFKTDPIKTLHQELQSSKVLTFDQLSWPDPGLLPASRREVFGPNAHFLVMSLLRLQGGKPAAQQFISTLAFNQNWQFAFLSAYSAQFRSTLDVEKWWTLQTSYFLGKDADNSWDLPKSLARIQTALLVPAHVHRSTNDLPGSASVSLQTVLTEWDASQQDAALRRKVHELEQVRLRVATNYVDIVEEYRQLLAETLERRQTAGLPFGLRKQSAQKEVSRGAARRLNELDQRLSDISTNRFTGNPTQAASIGNQLPLSGLSK